MADTQGHGKSGQLSGPAYLRLVLLGALIGIPAALLAALFLALVHELEHLLWDELPRALGASSPPWYVVTGLPVVGAALVLAGRSLLPGDGGHKPLKRIGGGTTPIEHAPGIVLAAVGITGLVPKALISTYLSFFPVAVGMVKGLRSPELMHLDLMHTYNASRAQTFWKLRVPASVPFLFASMKVAVAASLVGAIVAELVEAGIGAKLLAGAYYSQTIDIWAVLVAGSVVAALLVAAVGLASRIVERAMGGRPA